MKIELFGEMLLMSGERKERHTIPTLKHNSVRIMLWGCLSVSRAGILIKVWRVMKKEESVKNLEENLKQSAAKLALGLGHHFVFKHVSDPKSSWWRATSWRPKWTLLTGLHKALIWIKSSQTSTWPQAGYLEVVNMQGYSSAEMPLLALQS